MLPSKRHFRDVIPTHLPRSTFSSCLLSTLPVEVLAAYHCKYALLPAYVTNILVWSWFDYYRSHDGGRRHDGIIR